MVIVESIAILAAVALCALGVSPSALRHVAARLIAHAEGLEAFRRTRVEAIHYWRGQLGLDPAARLRTWEERLGVKQ